MQGFDAGQQVNDKECDDDGGKAEQQQGATPAGKGWVALQVQVDEVEDPGE